MGFILTALGRGWTGTLYRTPLQQSKEKMIVQELQLWKDMCINAYACRLELMPLGNKSIEKEVWLIIVPEETN